MTFISIKEKRIFLTYKTYVCQFVRRRVHWTAFFPSKGSILQGVSLLKILLYCVRIILYNKFWLIYSIPLSLCVCLASDTLECFYRLQFQRTQHPILDLYRKNINYIYFPFFVTEQIWLFPIGNLLHWKRTLFFFWLWFSLGSDGRFQLRLDGDRWICAIGDIARTKAVNAPCEDDGSQVDMFSWTAQSTIKWPTSP